MKTIHYLIFTLMTFVLFSLVPSSFAQETSPEYVVRTIYFIPNDLEPSPVMDKTLDTEIKNAQKFYADQMEIHGFERKTFSFEADADGNVLVHHLTGEFNDLHYQDRSIGSSIVWNEVNNHFDLSNNIYVLVLESKSHILNGVRYEITSKGIYIGEAAIIGLGSGDSQSGKVLLPAVNLGALIHELGHAFGLQHDSRVRAKRIYTKSTIRDWMITSFCAAEWLDVHRYFNTTRKPLNQNTSVRMLTPSLDSPPHAIRLQFEVSDPDGLHQAHLFKPFGDSPTHESLLDSPTIIDCRRLDGASPTVKFVTTDLVGGNSISIIVMDKNGNYIWNTFPIDVANLLSQAEGIYVPDPNLASALREAIGLSPRDMITQIDMLKLTTFVVPERQITDLTGLEHATRLRRFVILPNQVQDISPISKMKELVELSIRSNNINSIQPISELIHLDEIVIHKNNISDISPIESSNKLSYLVIIDNPVSDITPIGSLTEMQWLGLYDVNVSDITPLSNLFRLENINIQRSPVVDITPLSSLTQLEYITMQDNNIVNVPSFSQLSNLRNLVIAQNRISDVGPFAELKNLTNLVSLDIRLNRISDITPLAELTHLKYLDIFGNSISDLSTLSALVNLEGLQISDNSISDISPLSDLRNLINLTALRNDISDISPLSNLIKLRGVNLGDNKISDVSPLLELVNLESVVLANNPISRNRKPLLELLRINPNIRIFLTYDYSKPLPVTLSHFRAEYSDAGVVLKWTTESEVDNAGFYIYRSQTKDGEFKAVTPRMIQGAGTTGERTEYTWTDTTAKPNTVYYYRIEDVSHAGVREQLATVRLRGLISARGKLNTSWVDLKMPK